MRYDKLGLEVIPSEVNMFDTVSLKDSITEWFWENISAVAIGSMFLYHTL